MRITSLENRVATFCNDEKRTQGGPKKDWVQETEAFDGRILLGMRCLRKKLNDNFSFKPGFKISLHKLRKMLGIYSSEQLVGSNDPVAWVLA